MLLCIGGRVRWIQRSGYLITSLLFPSSAPWTGRNNIKESHNVSLTWRLTEVWSLPAPAASPGLWQPCWRSWSWWKHRSAREELWCFLFHQTCNHGNTQPLCANHILCKMNDKSETIIIWITLQQPPQNHFPKDGLCHFTCNHTDVCSLFWSV